MKFDRQKCAEIAGGGKRRIERDNEHRRSARMIVASAIPARRFKRNLAQIVWSVTRLAWLWHGEAAQECVIWAV
jgi:hypothetical protein